MALFQLKMTDTFAQPTDLFVEIIEQGLVGYLWYFAYSNTLDTLSNTD